MCMFCAYSVLCMFRLVQGVRVKIRPPIFRKKIENDKKNEKFKGNFRLYREIQGQPNTGSLPGRIGMPRRAADPAPPLYIMPCEAGPV